MNETWVIFGLFAITVLMMLLLSYYASSKYVQTIIEFKDYIPLDKLESYLKLKQVEAVETETKVDDLIIDLTQEQLARLKKLLDVMSIDDEAANDDETDVRA